MLEIVFPRFQISKFSGGHAPAPPRQIAPAGRTAKFATVRFWARSAPVIPIEHIYIHKYTEIFNILMFLKPHMFLKRLLHELHNNTKIKRF